MNIKNKITATVAAFALLLVVFASSASAATSVIISGNGAGSRSIVSIETDRRLEIVQRNFADIRNNINVDTNSGNNKSNFNTGGDNAIVTGDANSTVSIINHANHNFLNIGSGFEHDNGNNGVSEISHHFTGLNGEEEVPGPGDPNGFGFAHIKLNGNTNMLCSKIMVGNIVTPTAAHLHKAPAGQKGDVVVSLPTPTDGSERGCVTVDHNLIMDIHNNPSEYYVNVHNAEYPDGAVRGQL